jgi:hypothetical protein
MKKLSLQAQGWASVAIACAMVVACGGEDDADPNMLMRDSALARGDWVAPSLTVNTPTTLGSYATSTPTVALAGVAKDNQKVARVTWVTSLGNGVADMSSAGASATWSAAGVPLAEGDNTVVLRAYDSAGNRSTTRLSVAFTATPPSTQDDAGTWLLVAADGQGFAVQGTQRVRFGSDKSWIERSVSNNGDCTTEFFGSDPLIGAQKTCEVLVAGAIAAAAGGADAAARPASQAPGTPITTAAPTATTTASSAVNPNVVDPSLDVARAQLPSGSLPSGNLALAAGDMRWSDPATWGGSLPAAGAEVVVPAGKTVVLDTNTAALGAVRVEGTLRFAAKDVSLTAASIRVTGAMLAGTAGQPYAHRATITLTGAPASVNDGTSRGLIVQGGRLELYGAVPQPVWTRLNEHAGAGAKSLTLASTVNWRNGDTLAVAPSDYYGVHATERVTMNNLSGKTVSLDNALAASRWGKLQYVTSTGMSLTPEPGYAPPVAPAPTILDERAAVANLSRNIVIQGVEDAHWSTNGFGAHVMVMDLRSKAVVDGVEFRRVGQAGTTGRYPFHWHMLSYNTAGQSLGEATGHVIRNSSVWDSSQRCIVVHGTNGVQVLNNVCQDIKGHAFFLEDATERRNVFNGNIALKMRAPVANKLLQVHEGPEVYLGGPSGFWLTNPDNSISNNLAADAEGNGFWMAFPSKSLGLSAAVPIRPDSMALGAFHNNVAHSNRRPGVLLENVPIDAAGNVELHRYAPTVDGSVNNWQNLVSFELKRVTSYKNLDGAYRNRTTTPQYLEWTTADNVGAHLNGAVHEGTIARSLLVGSSLNNATPYPNIWPYDPPSAFGTYHSTLTMQHNTMVNFPIVEGKASGAWKTNDYYITAVDKGLSRNINNRLIASNGGYRELPPHMDGQPLANRHWTLAGALWDVNGYWGPKNNYWVYDVPFLTAGANCQWVVPAGKNGKTCDGDYFSVEHFQTDFDMSRFEFKAPLEAVRQDSQGGEIGRWSVADGNTSTMLGNMRHFAARNGGRYTINFPGRPAPSVVHFNIANAYRAGDSVVLGVKFNGGVRASGYTVAGRVYQRDTVNVNDPAVRKFVPVGSLAEVINSSSGDKMWQDPANNMVWIKYQGGMTYPNAAALVPNSDDDLYRPVSIILRAP